MDVLIVVASVVSVVLLVLVAWHHRPFHVKRSHLDHLRDDYGFRR